MVGEPLLRMGEDLMGVKLPVEMELPRTGWSGLAGRGCASVGEEETGISRTEPAAMLAAKC